MASAPGGSAASKYIEKVARSNEANLNAELAALNAELSAANSALPPVSAFPKAPLGQGVLPPLTIAHELSRRLNATKGLPYNTYVLGEALNRFVQKGDMTWKDAGQMKHSASAGRVTKEWVNSVIRRAGVNSRTGAKRRKTRRTRRSSRSRKTRTRNT